MLYEVITRASLISATELSEDTVEKIQAALSQKTKKKIILDVAQDPELIGGIVTKIGDLVWDGSIVITSYSIHYTKLYESRRWKSLAMCFFIRLANGSAWIGWPGMPKVSVWDLRRASFLIMNRMG